jgi:hypothetical protein
MSYAGAVGWEKCSERVLKLAGCGSSEAGPRELAAPAFHHSVIHSPAPSTPLPDQ